MLKNEDLNTIKDFDAIRITIASPEEIRAWSFGEVKKPETINYRTFKPERDGLFCARIFGPVKDYECSCGKYKRMKYKGVICEKCGVEVTLSRVRRERMGHIELAAPVAHVWFLKSIPSHISIILDRGVKELEKILYFEKYVILDPGMTAYKKYDTITEQEYNEIISKLEEHEIECFKVGIGAEAVRTMLENLDLDKEISKLTEELPLCTLELKKKKLVRRLKLLKSFKKSGVGPENMILTVLPVIPPELRPLVALEGGRFATSDLNDLYRRVINRNNRLKRLLAQGITPDVVIRNEKRMLQEAVDALFDNKRRGNKAITGTGKRPLKSLSDMLKGKQGRFRQNLLGKRVDYSGRSVITVGPELKLHQCGLPKAMALELFKPFVFAKLEKYGLSSSLKSSQRLVEQGRSEVWDILEEVMREHPVLLNRAPTLHRLSIQAFEPILTEGKSIKLHPLVCAAFNADFDGDQMAVHVPLSIEAQLEARILMLSTNNILSPSSGKPIVVPSKDIVLGMYYLTMEIEGLPNEGHCYADLNEIYYALQEKMITYHTKIKTRIPYYSEDGSIEYKSVDTTPGRVIFYQIFPHNHNVPFDLANRLMTSTEITGLIDSVYFYCGQKETAIFVDKIMEMGFKYMTKSGISYGKDDLIIPAEKQALIKETEKVVSEYEQQYLDGFITQGEKYNKVIDAWSKCGDKVADALMTAVARTERGQQPNSVYMMMHSKARGSMAQLRQSSGMRGLMAKPTGEIIETPIISSFKEGLSVLEYFISTHGSRKGLTDTALKTANSGYLTRRLVDVANDCVVTEEDCGTRKGIMMKPIYDGSNVVVSLKERILGRYVATDIINPNTGALIVSRNGFIDEYKSNEIIDVGIDEVLVRSSVTCETKNGICCKCYGRDLARGEPVGIGEAIGVIAAQSIGEPGTQLTMRTFHIGGTAQKNSEQSGIEASMDARISFKNMSIVENSKGENIVLSKKGEIALIDENGRERISYKVPYGSALRVKAGNLVKAGTVLADWDPYTTPVVSEVSGYVKYTDLVDGVSLKEVTDETTGISNKVVVDWSHVSRNTEFRPHLALIDENGKAILTSSKTEARHFLSIDTIITVNEGDYVKPGDVLARIPKDVTKTKDITGGLPRVSELFEARMPKDPAILTDMDGYIEFGKDYKSKKRIRVVSEHNEEIFREYLVSKHKSVVVHEGDLVKKGDTLVDGTVVLQDILRIMGVEYLARYFVDEVQKVYRLQGVSVNDKHIEVILRQMLHKREVINPGNSTYITGDEIDKDDLELENEELLRNGQQPIESMPILEGITRAALRTKSFISAASFQETTRVLTEAALSGKVDYLTGLKENVIIGRLMPAGTGSVVKKWKSDAKQKQTLDTDIVMSDTTPDENMLPIAR